LKGIQELSLKIVFTYDNSAIIHPAENLQCIALN
jgi:hypothetical protein